LIIPKIIRFSIFRDIKDEGDDIDIVDYVPVLNERTKNFKVMLEGKDDTIAIEKELFKKR
jgi:hypothetical protein